MPITRRRLLFAMLSTNAIGMPVNGHKFLMAQPYDEAFHLWAKRQLAECGKIIGLAKLSGSVAELDEALVILGVFNLIGAKCSLTNVLSAKVLNSFEKDIIDIYEDAVDDAEKNIKKAGKRKSANAKISDFRVNVNALMRSLEKHCSGVRVE